MSEPSAEARSNIRANPHRCAGVLVPLFSIRSEDDLGIGDVSGLKQFIEWAANAGFGFVQLLPINETGPDNSPYNAISSVAVDPLTLDCSPSGLEDLPESVFWEVLGSHNLNQLRRGPVQYEPVRMLKFDMLWRAFSAFLENHYDKGTDRDQDFHHFCESEKEWLGDYCLFRLLMDMEGGNHVWQDWSEEFNTLEKARNFVDRLLDVEPEKTERQLVYYAYVQWVAGLQWREARNVADDHGIRLMGDIPFGISLCSADVFANPAIFDLDWFGGAPPEKVFKGDPFVQKWGQNWGIPLYRWDELEKCDYSWWRQRTGKVTEIFSLFRIDHALGFFRIYGFPWNPIRNDEFLPLTEEEVSERCDNRLPGFRPRHDESPDNRKVNCEEGTKYLRIIREAAGDAGVIAEDLGVVPGYVRPALTELGIAGMKVPQWEHGGSGVTQGNDYPELSFATYATHDHPPLHGQWEEKRTVLKSGGDGSEEAKNLLSDLCRFAGINRDSGEEEFPAWSDSIRDHLLRALAESNSRYVAFMITDLFGLDDRINVPGVLDESNWSFRLGPTVRDLNTNPHWIDISNRTRKLLIETRRASSLAADAIQTTPPENPGGGEPFILDPTTTP